jgi:hypothetical protein
MIKKFVLVRISSENTGSVTSVHENIYFFLSLYEVPNSQNYLFKLIIYVKKGFSRTLASLSVAILGVNVGDVLHKAPALLKIDIFLLPPPIAKSNDY